MDQDHQLSWLGSFVVLSSVLLPHMANMNAPLHIATDFLAPSPNDQWNCHDVIDFPLLSLFAEREKNGSSDPFISTTSKTKHPESTIV